MCSSSRSREGIVAALDLGRAEQAITKATRRPPFTGGGTLYAACAVSACRLTSVSAISLSVLSVVFFSFKVASSNFTASLYPSSFAQSVP